MSRSKVPERSTLIAIGTSVVVTLISVFSLFRIKNIAQQAGDLVSDGRRVFAPGQLVGDQAAIGLKIVLLSLAFILFVAFVARKRTSTTTLSAVLTVISLGTVAFVLITFQQYREFLPV